MSSYQFAAALVLFIGSTTFVYALQLNKTPANVRAIGASRTSPKPIASNYVEASPTPPSNSVLDFQVTPFTPTFSNEHYQTIIGSGALQSKLLGCPERPFRTSTERIDTTDGDFFDVEYTDGYEHKDSIVIILHGLESSTKGNLVTRFTSAFLSKGYGCCLVGFRGCNQEPNLTPGAYHLGFTDDLNHLTDLLHKRYPLKNIYLSGFSLGGNVALKFLGELGEKASERNIKGAVVTCVPFDPVSSQGKLDKGFNKAVYSGSFLATLKVKAEEQNTRFPGLFDIEAIRKCSKIGDFDDLYIAKIYGYKDKVDYYRKTGSKWWLPKIRVPVIAINARDDPFIEESSLPTSEDIGPLASPFVNLIYTTYGGHCGFIGAKELFSSFVIMPARSDDEPHWLSMELARGLEHIRGIYGERDIEGEI